MDQREKLRLYTSSKHKGTTSSHERMRQRHVEINRNQNLKLLSKDYDVDPSEDNLAICIRTGQEIVFSMIQGLFQASELGNEKYFNFVNERCVEGENPILEFIC